MRIEEIRLFQFFPVQCPVCNRSEATGYYQTDTNDRWVECPVCYEGIFDQEDLDLLSMIGYGDIEARKHLIKFIKDYPAPWAAKPKEQIMWAYWVDNLWRRNFTVGQGIAINGIVLKVEHVEKR